MKSSLVLLSCALTGALANSHHGFHRHHARAADRVSHAPGHHKKSGFVTARGSELWLDGKPLKFVSLNQPQLLNGDEIGEFEYDHTFASFTWPRAFPNAITRTYTLSVTSANVEDGHILNWDTQSNKWVWNERRLVHFDRALEQANKYGAKLVIPFVNDGSVPETNWVGDYFDLIRMRKNLSSYEDAQKVDWFTDRDSIDSFKLIIDHLAKRVNTLTGVKYSEDPAVLAWQTGNEMNFNETNPAPAAWTLEIAKHLRKVFPNHLVADGSFARNPDPNMAWPKEVLESDLVDIVAYHYYPQRASNTSAAPKESVSVWSRDVLDRIKQDALIATSHNKVYIATEFGFFATAPEPYDEFLRLAQEGGAAGALVWGLRPASPLGGYHTHGEYDGHFSYHIPGNDKPLHPEFDPREKAIVASLRAWSWKYNNLPVPDRFPVPSKPPGSPWFVGNSTTEISFQSGVWGAMYQLVLVSGSDESLKELDSKLVSDSTKMGELAIDIPDWVEQSRKQSQKCGVMVRGVGVDGDVGPAGKVLWF
ncbi:hypothetical protein ACM66B_004112 [Microbotryomycetes sp. NB124-2]